MEIRPGTPEDLPALKALDTAIASDANRASFIEEAVQMNTVRVAHLQGEILGYSVVNHSFFRRPTLEMLMVAKERRRTGVGRALLRDALRLCNEAQALWTSTNESNEAMQSLLAAEGFSVTGRVENLDIGDPEIIYFRRSAKA